MRGVGEILGRVRGGGGSVGRFFCSVGVGLGRVHGFLSVSDGGLGFGCGSGLGRGGLFGLIGVGRVGVALGFGGGVGLISGSLRGCGLTLGSGDVILSLSQRVLRGLGGSVAPTTKPLRFSIST